MSAFRQAIDARDMDTVEQMLADYGARSAWGGCEIGVRARMKVGVGARLKMTVKKGK